MDKLTETEYRILNELIQDSSEPITRLSRKLGLSRNTVSKTIRNLASRGVITRFTIEVGREYINDDVMAILITETKPTRLDLFSEIYESVDGRFIGIIKANNLAEIRKAIRRARSASCSSS
ncbi:MAG: Lrp/AsnC family transcriptional regulator [Thermocladium sp.]